MKNTFKILALITLCSIVSGLHGQAPLSQESKSYSFSFPIGFLDFHKDMTYNYQLNRWNSLGFANESDLRKAAANIKNFDDWERELLAIARTAEKEKRYLNAAFYYRAAEFYIPQGTPNKISYYRSFRELFSIATQDIPLEHVNIPYQGAFLPAMKLSSSQPGPEKSILIHGGFDSFMEEFLSIMLYFSSKGYTVYAFDGPGQGAALRLHNLTFDYEWEKPVSVVLDHFKLDDVTLLGISLGGYLSIRAAAFEPRINRVIPMSVSYDSMEIPPKILQPIVRLFYFKFRDFTNKSSWKQIEKGGQQSWYLSNLMYMTGVDQPIDGIDIVSSMSAEVLHSERVTQDVLILTGRNDHLVPFKLHKMQVKALINATSVTEKIYNKSTHANNHCQIGNVGLAMQDIVSWLEELENK